jgi:DNA-binding transcriptional LysR family regulator
MPSSPIDVMQVIGTFHRRYPGIEFEISDAPSMSMVASLQRGELDAAVVGLAAVDLPPGLSSIHLADEPLVAVVSTDHPLANRASVGLAELTADGNFIHFSRESGLRRCVESAFVRAGVPPMGAFEMGRIIDMIRLAAHGVGVTVVPGPDADEATAIAGTGFAVIPLADEDAVHPVRLAFDQDRSSRATDAFVAEFRAYLGSAIGGDSSAG